MAHPLNYFIQFEQGEKLVKRFGDRELDGLSQTDQTALLAILAHFIYMCQASEAILPIAHTASDAIQPDDDLTTGAINEAIAILEGITPGQALPLIGFLVQ
jgi:hypothetical protein